MGFDTSGPAAAAAPSHIPDRSKSPPASLENAALIASFCEMAADWCKLLASDRSVSTVEVGVGSAGMAAMLLLVATPGTAAQLMCAGGVASLIGGCMDVVGDKSVVECTRVESWAWLGVKWLERCGGD